jgi:hypothetical protein
VTTPTIEQIIENWLDLANQTMRHADNTLQHGFVSANEGAIELLEALGLVTEVEPEKSVDEIFKLIGR